MRAWARRAWTATARRSSPRFRIDRRSLVSGLFYGIDGMRVGGTRRLEIAPHLAYGDRGVPDVIPAGALLTAEVSVLEAL
jgi:FKBP-type peptidyl-prolyl cis-trans isomerase